MPRLPALCSLLLLPSLVFAASAPPALESAERWYREGATTARAQGAGKASARNLVIFIGDGMGLTTVSAARIFAGQQRGASGEEHRLSFETFPHTALSKTYNTDLQTPDSAGTVTAMASGIKTRAGVIGLDQRPARGDCAGSRDAAVPNLVELAEAAGLLTGIVTTTRVTHATPAGFYAHVPERDWESDADLPAAAREAGCRDIARQLLEFGAGNGPELVLGGGRAGFLPRSEADPEHAGQSGRRQDGRNLAAEWQARAGGGRYVWKQEQFAALDPADAAPVLGLFEPGHLRFEHDRAGDVAGEPSLAEMTRFALRKLSRARQGYVLVVEAGRIDHAHHAGNAYRALSDTVALDEAVRVALELTAERDTLILVTADHSHTLSFAGYSVRGNPILGKVFGPAAEDGGEPAPVLDLAKRPYTTLAYANGPGYAGASDRQDEGSKRFPHAPGKVRDARGRPDLSAIDTTAPDYLQEALVPRESETHGGEDVPVYARGPGAEAVRGVIEQNVIFHLLAQAQPAIRRELCRRGGCEGSVPLRLSRGGGTTPGE